MKKYIFITIISIASFFALTSIYAGSELESKVNEIFNSTKDAVSHRNTDVLPSLIKKIDGILDDITKDHTNKFENKLATYYLTLLKEKMSSLNSNSNYLQLSELNRILDKYQPEIKFYQFINECLDQQISEDIVVFIVGSGGDNITFHPQQEIPSFCNTPGKSFRCFNLDINFSTTQPIAKPEVISTRHKVSFPGSTICGQLSLSVATKQKTPTEEYFIHALDYLINQQNKQVILVSHISAFMPIWFYTAGKHFSAEIGKKLHIIGAYFDDCPAIIYSPTIFINRSCENAEKIISDIVAPKLGTPGEKTEKIFLDPDDNSYNGYIGKLFKLYSEITFDDLFITNT